MIVNSNTYYIYITLLSICCILASNWEFRNPWNRGTIASTVTRLDRQRVWNFEMENRDTMWEIVTRLNNFLTTFTWKGLFTTVGSETIVARLV